MEVVQCSISLNKLPSMTSSSAAAAAPPITNAWIVDFVLRQPIPDSLAISILAAVPLLSPAPLPLRQSILVRHLSSDLIRRSITPTTLDTLELLHRLRPVPSPAIQSACSAVAVHCALQSLRRSNLDFADAVERIWNGKMADIERLEGRGLVDGSVRRWRGVMELAVMDEDVRGMLMRKDSEGEAVEAVEAYLRVAAAAMGPPVLEVAAGLVGRLSQSPQTDDHKGGGMLSKQEASKQDGRSSGNVDSLLTPAASKTEDLKPSCAVSVKDPDAVISETETVSTRFGGARKFGNDNHAHTNEMVDGVRNVGESKGNNDEVEVNDVPVHAAEMDDDEVLCSKSFGVGTVQGKDAVALQAGCLLRAIVSKVRVDLKRSCADQFVALKEPLSEALVTTSEVVASRLAGASEVEKSHSYNQLRTKQVAGDARGVQELHGNHVEVDVNEPVYAAEMADEVRCANCSHKDNLVVQPPGDADPSPHSEELDRNRDDLVIEGASEKPVGEDTVGSPSLQEASKQIGCCSSKVNSLLTPLVSKVSEDLKTSCADLQMAVKDPLPDTVITASEIVATRLGGDNIIEESQHNDNQLNMNKVVCDTRSTEELRGTHDRVAVNESVRAAEMCDTEPNQHLKQSEVNADFVEGTDGTLKGRTSTGGGQRKRSLMDRNTTAHTYEWSDSIDSPYESSPSPGKKLRLSSPRRMGVSPLQVVESKRLNIRRRKRKWSLTEEDTLRAAVEKYGAGRWKLILSCNPEIFEERTEVDLKDKWRNMTKH